MLSIYLNKFTSTFEEGIGHREEGILNKSAMKEDRKKQILKNVILSKPTILVDSSFPLGFVLGL